MRATPPERTPALRSGPWKALVLGLLVAGLLIAGTVRGVVNAKPATVVQPGGSTTPQPPRPTPTSTAPLPPACELEPLAVTPRSTGFATPISPSPTPWPVVSDALFPGQYQLERSGDLVTAILTTEAVPLPPPPVLFTVPPAYRPPSLLWRDVAGRVVRADGTPHPAYPEPVPFRLWLHPDGTVRQALQLDPAEEERYLAYELVVSWGTTPAANDQAVLALLDERWFGTSVLSQWPSPSLGGANHEVSIPAHPYWKRSGKQTQTIYTWMAFDDRLRVTRLHVRDMAPFAPVPSELAQLGQLEELVLDGIGVAYMMESRRGRLASNEPLPPGLTGPIPPELGLLTRLQRLALPEHQLTGSIPPTLGNLARLQELDLSRNLLSGAVPPELGSLTQLRRLNLHDNWLTTLPSEIGQLDCLRKLDMGENFLLALPPELGQLANLTHLSLGSNFLSVLPPELGQLANLRWLELYSNRLYKLPPELGQLANLEELILEDNRLYELPPELGQLQKLGGLYAQRNRLTSLPPELGQLQTLTNLDLSHNQIATIPPELGPLAELDWDGVLHGFYISHNPLTGCLPAAWLNRWPNFTVTDVDAIGQRIKRQPSACPD